MPTRVVKRAYSGVSTDGQPDRLSYVQWIRVLRCVTVPGAINPSHADATSLNAAIWQFNEGVAEYISGQDCRVAGSVPFHKVTVYPGAFIEYEWGGPGEPFPGPAPVLSGTLEMAAYGTLATAGAANNSQPVLTQEYDELQYYVGNASANSATIGYTAVSAASGNGMPLVGAVSVAAGTKALISVGLNASATIVSPVGALSSIRNSGANSTITYELYGRRR